MNNTSDSNKRKKKIVSGTASVKRRDDKPVGTSGPVGRKDGYQGRRTQYGSQNSSGSSGNGGSLFSSLFGGGHQNQSQQSQNDQQYSQQTYSQDAFSQDSGSSSSGSSLLGGLLGGKIGKILILIVLAVGLFFLFRCVCSGSSSSAQSAAQNCAIFDLFGGESGIVSDIAGSNTFDVTDNEAPAAISASTSTGEINYTVSNKARKPYTKLKGNGNDVVTIMIYLCGSDLESEHSMATADLNEMLHANLDDQHVNIIVETGGARKWNNSVISNKTNQRYRVTSRGLQVLDDSVGSKSMVDSNTLVSFIKYCAKNYPASRYMLIMWDHGGGAITGYGYDEKSSGSMTLDKLNNALEQGGVKFDFIGFDACLMGTLETALVSERHADYLIASEEAEPGTGWYYTNWLTQLSKNPSIDTVTLAKTLIDDFTDVSRKNYPGCNTTLSIVDLAEFAGTVPDAFNAFSSEISGMLDNSEYRQVADARADAREFGVSAKVNHIDVIDFASRIGGTKANALVTALKGCIRYNRTSVSMKNSYGVSIYFPYSSFKSMNSAVALYNNIGISGDYSRCIKSFASLAAGGQIATGGTAGSPYGSLFGDYGGYSYSSGDVLGSLLGSYLGGSGDTDTLGSLLGDSGSLLGGLGGSSVTDYLGGILGGDSYGWFDSGRALANKDYYDANSLTVADLQLTEKGDGYVLSLSGDKWDLVRNVQLNVFVKDEQTDGYLDLGMDRQFAFDSDGDLVIDYDNRWLTLDGNAVAYYFLDYVEDGENWAEAGRVPVLLNGERYDLLIVFDNEIDGHEDGYVAGAQRVYDESETLTVGKGLVQLKKGDQIDFICDYYSADGSYQATYYLGNSVTFDGELAVAYMDIGDSACEFSYCLTDLYGNEFWTETLRFD